MAKQILYALSFAHSPSFPSFHLRHSSFSNPSLALPTSQLILQPLRCFTYVTALSPTLLSLFLRHRIFTYVTWRAAHATEKRTRAAPRCALARLHPCLLLTARLEQGDQMQNAFGGQMVNKCGHFPKKEDDEQFNKLTT